MIDDLDPDIEAAFRKLNNAAEDLETERIRAERTSLTDVLTDPVEVNIEILERLAAHPDASPELKSYASQVARGYCEWHEIETKAHPLPREIADLKASTHYNWWYRPAPKPPPVQRVREIPGEIYVDPIDWSPEDDDPLPDSWLT